MLRSLINRIEYYFAAERLRIAGRRVLQHWKYRPDQPRVPAGSSEGGQWTFDPGAISHHSPSASKPGRSPSLRDTSRHPISGDNQQIVKIAGPWNDLNRPK